MPVTTDAAARPPLDETRLVGNPALPPDLEVELHATLGSTNARAAERAREGAAEGLVVAADHQTGGRGRLDRTWETPEGTSLTFSLLLRPTVPAASWPWLPLMTGYAVAKALRAGGVEAGVKWPNDVLVGDRKLAGILVERIETPQGPAAVVGVGINVGMAAEELPVPEATSLQVEQGEAADRTDLLVEVLSGVREAYDAWQAGGELGAQRLAESYAEACVTVGQQVRVELPGGETLEGTAVGIDAEGRLQVQPAAGSGGGEQVRAVGAGDVRHVRPASS
ncbi:biotin--[acetyl-CoA-carboxylase] ligase [Nocardioides nanhaiensis]|uniref:biotin--[biotin carboxyl-carrier protein] ligase n=1 Tax=Nocardioides nanhaiensis TaxID=1476871 RepID=A0ABP8W080_9ACTN